MDWLAVEKAITASVSQPFQVERQRSVGGGCINSAWQIEGPGQAYFIKLNSADKLDMFEAEAEGLREIAATQTLRVPQPVCCGTSGGQAWLVQELLSFGGGGRGVMGDFGTQLAQMHRETRSRFGWQRDNTIGSTPQLNMQEDDWVTFWRERRLGYQLQLAGKHGVGNSVLRKGERLMTELAAFFSDYQPQASLLHGDLWSGNYSVLESGQPVIFDPAVYFGDREADLAMTELFGGFSGDFYAAYTAAWPLDQGYAIRKTLYNLYHILNHFNLFGGGYASQAESMLDRLLSELRA